MGWGLLVTAPGTPAQVASALPGGGGAAEKELAGNMLSSLPTPGSLPSPFRSQSGAALSPGLVLRHMVLPRKLAGWIFAAYQASLSKKPLGVGTKQLLLPSLSHFSGVWALITPGPSLLLKNPKYDCDIPVAVVIGYEEASRGPFGVDFGVKDVV